MARRTKEDAEATRNSLLDAAERVFYDKGVSRASLADIAQAAGATRGAVYWHFKDKVDLFGAMMDRVTLPLECAYGPQAEGLQVAPLQRLRAVIQGVLQAVVCDERARRVFEIAMYKVEYVQELNAVRDRHVQACAGFRARLGEDLAAAARLQGVVLAMPEAQAAMGLWALFDGLLQGWMLGAGGFDLLAVGRVTVDAYLRGLGLDLLQACDNPTLAPR